MAHNIDIRDPLVIFGSNADDIIGVVSYGGTLNNNVPLEMHLDTENRELSVLFENGHAEKLCDLSAENVATASRFYDDMRKVKDEVCLGFYQVDEQDRLRKPCYHVPVLMM